MDDIIEEVIIRNQLAHEKLKPMYEKYRCDPHEECLIHITWLDKEEEKDND